MNRLLLQLIFISFISCGSKDKGELLTIDVPGKTEIHYLSEIASEAVALRLETTEDCLISSVIKIEATNMYYFIFSNNKLLMFDKEGRFIRRIGQIGRGPGEYQYLSTFTVDENNEKVYLGTDRNIMCYNFKGSFLAQIDFPKLNAYIDLLDDNIYLISSNEPIPKEEGTYSLISSLYKFNDELELKDSILIRDINFPRPIMSYDGFGRYISDLDDKILLFFPVGFREPNVRDTLFQINGNKLIPFVKVRIEDAYNDPEAFYMRNIFCVKNFLFAEYYLGNNPSILFCYNFENEIKMNMELGFLDDILNTGVTKLEPFDPINGLMYFIKQANEVTDIIDGVDEFDNPVIIFVKLNE